MRWVSDITHIGSLDRCSSSRILVWADRDDVVLTQAREYDIDEPEAEKYDCGYCAALFGTS